MEGKETRNSYLNQQVVFKTIGTNFGKAVAREGGSYPNELRGANDQNQELMIDVIHINDIEREDGEQRMFKLGSHFGNPLYTQG